MSALRKPDFDPRYYPPQSQFQPEYGRRSTKVHPPQVKRVVKNRSFPQQNKLPPNLKLLSALQKTSFGLALASLLTSTGLYISTVQIPQLWSQEYRTLEDLQLQERELIAINEKIKYQIAREASQNAGLAISKPDSAVFIPPAKVEPTRQMPLPLKLPAAIEYSNLGY